MQQTNTTPENYQKMLFYIATSPVAVPENSELKKESAEEELGRYAKIANLPPKKRLSLSHFSVSQKIQTIGQKYQFELPRLANITRLIREYYFGEVPFQNFPTEIEHRMGVNLLTAQEITRYIKQEIIDWDPWAEYIAKLPKMPIRSIVQQYPKIANMEITAGYIELRNSEELEEPTIKNWLQDYISHLGYEKHPQMQRTQYLFHSENGKNLSSQDREKLGIILKSFDENIPLPVDEENGEIVFDEIIPEPTYTPPQTEMAVSKQQPTINYQRPTNIQNPQPAPPKPSFAPLRGTMAGKQESFIKPYTPAPQPQRLIPKPISQPLRQTSPPVQAALQPSSSFVPQSGTMAGKQETTRSDFATLPNKQVNSNIDKLFSAPESPDIPGIKVHSITERNEPRIQPQNNIPKLQHVQERNTPIQPDPRPRPKHKIINPFPDRISEPRIDGNIVDLSGEE